MLEAIATITNGCEIVFTDDQRQWCPAISFTRKNQEVWPRGISLATLDFFQAKSLRLILRSQGIGNTSAQINCLEREALFFAIGLKRLKYLFVKNIAVILKRGKDRGHKDPNHSVCWHCSTPSKLCFCGYDGLAAKILFATPIEGIWHRHLHGQSSRGRRREA